MAKTGLYKMTIVLWSDKPIRDIEIKSASGQSFICSSSETRFKHRAAVLDDKDHDAAVRELLGPADTACPLFEKEDEQP